VRHFNYENVEARERKVERH